MKIKKENDKMKLKIGIGISNIKDSYMAGKKSAEMALSKLNGKKPVISYVFYAGDYNPFKLSKGLKNVLLNTEFVGGSAPTIFYNDKIFHQGVLVLSLHSDFLRVGVASVEEVTKSAYKLSQKATINALKNIKLDKYIDPYIQFSRIKKGNVQGIIKVPTFILFAFTRGFKLNSVGRETDIIEGIYNVIGQYAPIFGGSFGVTLSKVFNNEDYDIYTLHSGKVIKNGLVIVIVNSGLIYTNTLAHGCKPCKTVGFVTKVEQDGYVVSSISEKSPIEWYADSLNISKEEFLSKVMLYTQNNPIGVPDGERRYVLRAGGMVYEQNKMSFVAPFKVGTPVVLMKWSINDLLGASKEIKSDVESHIGNKLKPAFALGVMCASREIVLKEKTEKELKMMRDSLKLGKNPFVGFYSFGEIGSKPGQACRFNHMTANIFLLYDRLIIDLPKSY